MDSYSYTGDNEYWVPKQPLDSEVSIHIFNCFIGGIETVKITKWIWIDYEEETHGH